MKIIKYFKLGIIFILKSPLIFIKYFIIGMKCIIITFPLMIIKKTINIFKKEKSPNKIISLLIISLSFSTYLICIFILTRWYIQTERNKKFTNSLTEQISLIINEENNTNEYKDTNNELIPSENISNTEINQNQQTNTTTPTYVPSYINVNLNVYTLVF